MHNLNQLLVIIFYQQYQRFLLFCFLKMQFKQIYKIITLISQLLVFANFAWLVCKIHYQLVLFNTSNTKPALHQSLACIVSSYISKNGLFDSASYSNQLQCMSSQWHCSVNVFSHNFHMHTKTLYQNSQLEWSQL